MLQVIFFLYGMSLLTSIAGMEMFSWGFVILGLFVHLKKNQWKPKFEFKLFPQGIFLLFFLSVIIGVLFNNPGTSPSFFIIGNARWAILAILLIWALAEVEAKSIQKLFIGLIGLAAIVGIYGVIQHFTGIDIARLSNPKTQLFGHVNGRAIYQTSGLFNSPMTFGNVMGQFFFIPLALSLLLPRAQLKLKLFSIAATFCCFLSLVTCFSRGVWVGVFFGTLVVISLYKKSWGIVLAGLVGLILVASFQSKNNSYAGRLTSIFNMQHNSNAERFDIWNAHLRVFKAYPFFGVGYAENDDVVANFIGEDEVLFGFDGHAHNSFIQILAGTGLVGTLFWLLLMGYFIGVCFKAYKKSDGETQVFEKAIFLGLLGSQVFIQFSGLTESNFTDAEPNHLYVFLMCVGYVLAKRIR